MYLALNYHFGIQFVRRKFRILLFPIWNRRHQSTSHTRTWYSREHIKSHYMILLYARYDTFTLSDKIRLRRTEWEHENSGMPVQLMSVCRRHDLVSGVHGKIA